MNLKDKMIGEIVAEDYRTATVFKNYGIDFCCNGNRNIEEACASQKIKKEELISELKEITRQCTQITSDFQSWPPDLLINYIEKKHHRYVRAQVPVLQEYLAKLCKVHGSRHPELFEIQKLFAQSSMEFMVHMEKEEKVLFPYIINLSDENSDKNVLAKTAFGTVAMPISNMMHEHEAEGGRFRKIKELSKDYTAPDDACHTYGITYLLLQEFENDLLLHIHLENNILFPKAIEMEKALKN
ncbi:MAG: iron-sulfur cluster repair di-iron protein [Bacteroidetes bacterium]|nr:iron-sulfur cluster repair di-iron protein [Bacteroidota bacterium]MBS1756480.1 iron-sulfur cluster repair di-iron protein [Bacteroidota bacterium]